MPTKELTIVFYRLEVMDQHMGPSDEHMVGTLIMSFTLDGTTRAGITASVKMPMGDKYSAGAPLEIGSPQGWSGPFDYAAFREAASQYAHDAVEGFFSMGPNASMTVIGSSFGHRRTATILVTESGSSSW